MQENNKKITYSFTCSSSDYSDLKKEDETNERIKKRIIENLIRDNVIFFSVKNDYKKDEITITATVNISR